MKKLEYLVWIIVIGLLVSNLYLEINDSLESVNILETIKVEVKGKVQNPGVYELKKGSRVEDLINISGGVVDGINLSNINLSSKLEDEMVIMIENDNRNIFYIENTCTCPVIKSSGCNNYFDKIFTTKVSINTATETELMTLEGIGKSKALAIIEYRKNNGSFNSIEELKNVKGIGNTIYEKIKNNITL